jgi:hypothetical protein
MPGFVPGTECPPALYSGVPVCTLGRSFAPLEVREGRLIRRDHSRACAGLDRHVADSHACFHIECGYGISAVFDDVAGAPVDANLADHRQDHVLGSDTRRQFTVNVDC